MLLSRATQGNIATHHQRLVVVVVVVVVVVLVSARARGVVVACGG